MDIQFIFLVSCLAEKLKKIMKKMCLWCSFNNMEQNLKRFILTSSLMSLICFPWLHTYKLLLVVNLSNIYLMH